MQFLLGIFFAVLVATLAYQARSLDRNGAVAAALVGAIIFGVGGWRWALLLLTFFISSSALSRAFKNRKLKIEEKFSKGHRRDAGQVFGNGGAATLFAALYFFFPNENWAWVAFAAALAAVNADTWATELGVLSRALPRLMINPLKEVEKGTSGGISLTGLLAASGGSALIAALAASLTSSWSLFPIIFLSGLLGSLFDSFLGATVQAMYYCPKDDKETEKHPLHSCGTATIHVRGWAWLNNDWVNFFCGAFGALTALLLL
ncbi:MAG: DUF92 domain-containing protein [Anaerolineales bacterium]|nr:DUF92 domain-containing protein [Anaerolineales bacterium]